MPPTTYPTHPSNAAERNATDANTRMPKPPCLLRRAPCARSHQMPCVRRWACPLCVELRPCWPTSSPRNQELKSSRIQELKSINSGAQELKSSQSSLGTAPWLRSHPRPHLLEPSAACWKAWRRRPLAKATSANSSSATRRGLLGSQMSPRAQQCNSPPEQPL
jgi:hypothetical protein